MTQTQNRHRRINRSRRTAGSVATVATVFVVGAAIAFGGTAHAAAVAVPMGTVESFVILAGAGVTNTGATTLNGDAGTFPTTSMTGTGSMTITGTNHAGDSVTQGAKDELVTFYNNVAAQGPVNPVAADLGGAVLDPGVYNSASSMGLTGTVTLDAGGDPDAVFVFQIGSALTTASNSTVALVDGAQACNVYWQVGSSATLGTTSVFRGSLVALTDISLTTGATVEGRMLARNGAVTLDTNTLTRPICTTADEDDEVIPPGEDDVTPPGDTGGPGDTGTPTGSENPNSPDSPNGPNSPDSPNGPNSPDNPDITTASFTPPERQVTDVPEGPVAAGDGSAAVAGGAGSALLVAALAAGGAVIVTASFGGSAALRRRTDG
jgi:hypothetical protein